jgi:uncharacterized protein
VVNLTWDEPKRRAVLRERGFDLLRAALILDGPVLVTEDKRHDYGETRQIAVGQVDGEYYTVVFTQRSNAFHIITAWRAGRRARRRHKERFG